MLQHGIRASIFNIEPGWTEKVELTRNFTEELFRSGQISVCRASMVNWEKVRKKPQFLQRNSRGINVEFMWRSENLGIGKIRHCATRYWHAYVHVKF
jgi:hypothetical protein